MLSPFFAAGCCSSASTTTDDSHSPENNLSAPPEARIGSSTSSTSSDPASNGSCSATDDSSPSSLLTIPSLPSLQSPPITSASDDSSIPVVSFACLSSFRRPKSSAAALAVSPSSSLLYAAFESEVTVYDLDGLRCMETFAAAPSAGAVKSVALLPDGRGLLTAHQDGRLRLWRRRARSGGHRLHATLPTLLDRLRRLPFPSSYVHVRRHHRRLWIQHADAVSSVAASPGGAIYSASWDRSLKVWRGSDLRCAESVAGAHDDAVNAVAVAPDGTVYTGSADRRIRVWAPRDGRRGRHALVATLERHRSAVNALALGGGGGVLYSGACDRSILVWEREDSAARMAAAGALRGHARAVLCLACAGDLLASGSADRTVRIWRRLGAGAYGCLAVMDGHAHGVRSLLAFPSGGGLEADADADAEAEEYRVCSGGLDGEVRVWRLRVSRYPNPRKDPT